MAALSIPGAWRYHPQRDALLAEAHVRPFTPLDAPVLATRIATLSGEGGEASDREHMTALCRRFGQPEPGPAARSCALDAGVWRLRWERHTEVSTWSFFRSPTLEGLFVETALDLVPVDWLEGLPGETLVAARLEVRPAEAAAHAAELFGGDAVGARLADSGAIVSTDFRPDNLGMTRFVLHGGTPDAGVTGRLAQSLLEIETYRLLAMLAFPVAGEAGRALSGIEARAADLAARLAEQGDLEADRTLLDRLAALAGETEALIGRTSTRFGAAEAYHDIVGDRIERLREERIDSLQTIGEFMQRRLDPAMRTCAAMADRQRAAIDRLARMTQMLNTRVEVAAEATSAAVLASMDERAARQLRLQQTVEGISTFAIAYYAVGLLSYPLNALARAWPTFDVTLATGLSAPLVLMVTWWALRRVRRRLTAEPGLGKRS